jgi:hypothetical protein
MKDDTTSGQPEGEALPVSKQIKATLQVDTAPLVAAIGELKADAERVIAAVERWYAAHFHAHAVAGTAPITADDKAALIQHVADAVAPTATQE